MLCRFTIYSQQQVGSDRAAERGLSVLCRFKMCRQPHTEVTAAYGGSARAARVQ